MLLALLLPDLCDPHCPEAFKWQAREILAEVRQPPQDDDGSSAVADWIERDPGGSHQQVLFPELDVAPKKNRRGGGRKPIIDTDAELQSLDAITLDRVHAAMLLQAGGHANALRNLIQSGQERGPGFLRLANALSALYSHGSEEKRLLDAMLLAVPR